MIFINRQAILNHVGSVLYKAKFYDPYKFRILTYHSIQDSLHCKWCVAPDDFEMQIKYLYNEGYETYTMSQIHKNWPSLVEKKNKSIALTFDDGFANAYTFVSNVLNRYNMTATFFVSTENIGYSRGYPVSKGLDSYRDKLMLCWKDIIDLHKNGFEIGSHSHSHDAITGMSRCCAYESISTSKRLLDANLQNEIVSFSYPYGHKCAYSTWTGNILKDLGFKVACTQMGGALSSFNDLFELPRIGICGSDSFDVFQQKVLGSYDFLKYLYMYY